MHVSPASHEPLPHTEGQAPQSLAHEPHVSPLLHAPSPQQAPQSPGQVAHVSPLLHVPSPHVGHAPQSLAHEPHVSPLSHEPLPQTGPPPQLTLHTAGTCATHALLHPVVQHDGYMEQSEETHGSHVAWRGAPA